MKPITGLTLTRAKAGMTIPAAPRMTSASESGVGVNGPALGPLCPMRGESQPRSMGGGARLAFRRRKASQGAMGAEADLILVGGGPAGMMAGLLFARAGCRVSVLEKHADFFRDFRGDTVHPSTMEILDQLGMLERFLKRPHNRVAGAELRIAGREWAIGDLSHLDTPAPFIAMMPQWEFLDFLREEAKAFPGFALEMCAPVAGFVEEGGRVAGVRLEDGSERRARLVVAADGRGSIVRTMLPLEDLGAPMDVFWFRIPRR